MEGVTVSGGPRKRRQEAEPKLIDRHQWPHQVVVEKVQERPRLRSRGSMGSRRMKISSPSNPRSPSRQKPSAAARTMPPPGEVRKPALSVDVHPGP